MTNRAQLQRDRNNQQFQLTLEAAKHERETAVREKAEAMQRLMEAHVKLSRIDREFSLTSVNILWRAEMTDTEYDQRYLLACAEMDALRAFAQLHEPTMSDPVEQLQLPMGMYWLNLNQLLYQVRAGRKVDHHSSCLREARDAAEEIGVKVASAKRQLTELMTR